MISNAIVSETGKRKIAECLVGDASACIMLKARNKEVEELAVDRCVRIVKCRTDMYQGSMRLACSPDSTFEDIDAVQPKVRSCRDQCYWISC